ncbi:MAG TPA: DUF1189 family protein [Candidatus Woesebacteria bacterium]|nr:DUF1189 family protein [Candidatus Woesebacteria bacterium]HNS94995.1 DUF1189 family protein [Candidatus Woesebacteria bacterium]
MLTILRNIIRACYDKSFYQENENDSFGRRYAHLYVLFMVVVSVFVVQMVGFYFTNRSQIEDLPPKINTFLDNAYPEDLTLRFEDSQLSINQPEPYVLGEDIFALLLSDEANSDLAELSEQSFSSQAALLTIDTTASIDDFDTYETAILAMKNGLAIKQSERGEVRYYPYADMLQEVPQPLTFDNVSYGQIVNRVRPFIDQIPSFVLYFVTAGAILMILLGPLFLTSGVLLNIVFLAVLGYFVARVIGRPHSYIYIYKLGMYAAIPVIVLQQITMLLAFDGLSGAWWLIALLILVLFIPRTGGALVKRSDCPLGPTDPPKIA